MRDLLEAVPATGLFPRGEKALPWLISPQPLKLNRTVLRRLHSLGHILARFQDAAQRIYRRSAEGSLHSWLAPMLDAGKPDWLVKVQRSPALRTAVPCIIRPDLLLGENGTLSLVEIDSVPGGVGITHWLSLVYAAAGFPVLGGADGIAQGMRRCFPQGATIAVSNESADYRPEMNWLTQQLGSPFCACRAELLPTPYTDSRPIYRFWELFDSDNIPASRELCQMAATGICSLSPPPVAHLEEKLWLALLHMPGMLSTWQNELRSTHLQTLLSLVPHSWVLDPAPLPAQAALPHLNLHSWKQVAALGRQARRLVLKISGFSPLSWGSRSVIIGHDVPCEQWQLAVFSALSDFPSHPWIMQEFFDAAIINHPYYNVHGDISMMRGRVRLCPYYFRADKSAELAGCLATIVPEDKKKIHGMADAILVPCIAG